MGVSQSLTSRPVVGGRIVAVGLGLCLALGTPGTVAQAGVGTLDNATTVGTALLAFMDRYPGSPEGYIRDSYASETYSDSPDDAQNVPELTNVAMGVPRDDPSTTFDDSAMLVVAAQTGGIPPATTVAEDDVGLALDTNGDYVDDYWMPAFDPPLELGAIYVSDIWGNDGAGTWRDTGYSAAWMRRESGYMALLDWRDLGLESVRVAFMLGDGSDLADHFDWAPDDYTGALRTLPVPPSEPLGVTAQPGLGTSVTVSWQAPGEPGPVALEYYVATAAPGGATCTNVSLSTLQCSIQGLAVGQSYTFTVVAYNFFGQSSPPSAPSPPITIALPPAPSPPVISPPLISAPVISAPSAPLDVTALALDGRAVVHWTAPLQPGVHVLRLEYVATADPGGATCTAGGPITYCVMYRLVNGQAYTFTVVARNEAGASPASAPSLPVTPLAPVVTVKVKAVSGLSKLKVDVDPNRGTVAGGTIDERHIKYWTFKVQVRLADGSWKTLKRTYRTLGSKETRTVNLKRGTYRVVVNPKYGYVGTTSAEVRLKK